MGIGGTVNISRKIWSDIAFKRQPFTEREAFIWLIMEASFKPREKRINDHIVPLLRGQDATSIRFMSEAWKWPKSSVHRFLERLKKRDMIGTQSGTGYTVITICKYDDYQSEINESGTRNKGKQGRERDTSGTNENKDSNKDSNNGKDLLGDKPPCKPDHVLVKDALACVIGDALAQDVFDHRKKLKKPLTVRAAEGLAKKFAKWHNPQEAAEAMITNGWQGFDPEWMKNKARGGSQGNFGMMDALIENERRRQSGQANDGPRYIENPFTGEMEEVKT